MTQEQVWRFLCSLQKPVQTNRRLVADSQEHSHREYQPLHGCRLFFVALSFFSIIQPVSGQLLDTLLHRLSHPFTNSPNFGGSVAVSGPRLVVGGWTGASSNYAYVYDLTSSTPNLSALALTYPDAEELDAFGNSVAIAETRVAVGAPSSELSSAGKVFIDHLRWASNSRGMDR
jgi:hypothetical protein